MKYQVDAIAGRAAGRRVAQIADLEFKVAAQVAEIGFVPRRQVVDHADCVAIPDQPLRDV
jgi:hypothetical protein